MNEALRRRYLEAIGVPVWTLRRAPGAADVSAEVAASAEAPFPHSVSAETPPPSDAPAEAAPEGDGIEAEWAALARSVRVCTRCALHRGRTQTVFGVGRRDASLMVIGEAPGAEEDRQGEPFVGRAGQLLNAMLEAIGYERREVYIANILKCRPPNNRDPSAEEAATCTPYLEQQIRLVQPRAILAVGRVAAQWLLQSDAPIGRLRGRVHRFGDASVPLVVTYHPAYLLRSPAQKAKTWQDLCMVRELTAAESTAAERPTADP